MTKVNNNNRVVLCWRRSDTITISRKIFVAVQKFTEALRNQTNHLSWLMTWPNEVKRWYTWMMPIDLPCDYIVMDQILLPFIYLIKKWNPALLAALFEYLFMFWLHRHLPAKSALNSKLTAKWLGFISHSKIWTEYIFR